MKNALDKMMRVAKEYTDKISKEDENITAVYAVGSMARGEKIYHWSDLDLRVVTEGENPCRAGEGIVLNDILVEIGYRGSQEFSDTRKILSDVRNYDVAFAPILFDRDGKLSEMQPLIKDEYTKLYWSIQRALQNVKVSNLLESKVIVFLNQRNMTKVSDFLNIWLSTLCQTIVILTNRSPSLRGLLPRFKHAVTELGQPELYKEMLEIFGVYDKTITEVKEWFSKAEEWYKIAINDVRSLWLKSDLKPTLKRYWIEGTSHIIEQGNYKDAALPISVILFQLNSVFIEETSIRTYESVWMEFKEWLGYSLECVDLKYNQICQFSQRVNIIG
ncbi:nucleotidyltransferase domain-containing protein [Bacillus sp. SD088]|uniref:nucleotidyltransferase domain-containing protein n=1 Tax=Bacillus sp. SD088 TaxID=2782012 RepID=UPI001A961104|nr:nucleotidyltransferase domain-containing protein [Bacillus sp. SD088]MBO0995910.1 nucleotidyltransferase domain-containing protein [Bacillus sp. SD088]